MSDDDPILGALARLPARPMESDAEARLRRQARAAYARSFDGSPWGSPAASLFGRAAVPVLLAGIVGVYMTWAITAATALVH